jgi:hypothetical protein
VFDLVQWMKTILCPVSGAFIFTAYDSQGETAPEEASERRRTQLTYRSTPMISLVDRGGKLRLTAFALALTVGIFSSSAAMAQHGGHGGGGGVRGTGQRGGTGHVGRFANRGVGNFGGFGGYGFYPGYYDPGFSGYGYGYPDYGAIGTSFGFPFSGYTSPDYGAIGTSFGFPYSGYGNGFGYGSTYSDAGF